jgi:hypothetical protein
MKSRSPFAWLQGDTPRAPRARQEHARPLSAAAICALVSTGLIACATPSQPPHGSAAQALAWNKIALESVERSKPTQHQVVRLLTYMSLAQHVAQSEARGDREALATASRQVIAALLPAQAGYVDERYRQLHAADSAAGARIAERVLAQAQSDGFARPWTGSVPSSDTAWHSLANPPAPPAYPAIGTMRTFFIASGDVFRSGPPPALDSQRFREDLAEVRRYTAGPTPETTRIAKFYDMTTGTLAGGFWNEQASALISRDSVGGRAATKILATLNMAMMDALVACHDTKYTYWVPRPSQSDPTIKPIIGVPNHPSYPSNHSCLSTAAGRVLGHFFPAERDRLRQVAEEAGISRIYAGIHYRFDVETGETIGRSVAAAAAAGHEDSLARLTRTVVSQR